ncbi:RHS repeat domain-containing protein, partial [Chryseobacterium culicis]
FNVETGKYVYNYIDHLGNIRLSYAKNGAGTEIIEESNYYPFGLKHEGYNVLLGNSAYKYKYNGKELQETGFYDYGWRQYMPDLGRWMQSDPLIKDLDFTFNPNDVDYDDDEISNISAGILLSNGGGIFNVNNLNPYGYGYNDPIRFNDPDGRCPTCLTALGGALIGGGLELGGQLLSGKSLSEVDWADVGVETLKGGLIGSGVGAGAAAAIEGGSIVAKAAVDLDVNKGNQNIFNGKKTVGKAVVDGAMDFAAGKIGGFVGKKLNGVASKALTKATTAETKAATILTRTTNTFNRVTANGTNTYGSRALNAKQSMSKAASSLKFARKKTAAAKITKTATQYGTVVNKAAQNSISDKIKSFFGIN